jgi:hypothetical protein
MNGVLKSGIGSLAAARPRSCNRLGGSMAPLGASVGRMPAAQRARRPRYVEMSKLHGPRQGQLWVAAGFNLRNRSTPLHLYPNP